MMDIREPQLEDSLLKPLESDSKLAVIQWISGESREFYKKSLKKHGFRVQMVNLSSSHPAKEVSSFPDWIFLICLDYKNPRKNCASQHDTFSRLKSKTDKFLGFQSLFSSRDLFCSTTNQLRQISTLQNPFTPLCFLLPYQYQTFLDVSQVLGFSAQWTLQDDLSPALDLDVFSKQAGGVQRKLASRSGVIKQKVPNQLVVFACPVKVRFFIAITSSHPLRAYLHEQGIVFTEGGLNCSSPMKSVADLWLVIEKNFGPESLKKVKDSLKDNLVKFLLISEAITLIPTESSQDHLKYFDEQIPLSECCSDTKDKHLVAVDVVFDLFFNAWIVDVAMGSKMHKSERSNEFFINKVLRLVIDDYVSLISSTIRVVNQVAHALNWITATNEVGIMNISCYITHDICLSVDDVIYLLAWRREALASTGFSPIYPSVEINCQNDLVNDLKENSAKTKMEEVNALHLTWDLHRLLYLLEKYFSSNKFRSQFAAESGKSDLISVNNCDTNSSSLPYISAIYFHPHLQLSPPFSPHHYQYQANVSHHFLIVTIYAIAKHCQSEVRSEDKYGSSQATNYTIGLGRNKINLLVVDITQTDPVVINTYTIIINRALLSESSVVDKITQSHKVCSLRQRCSLAVYPRDSCNMRQQGSYSNWFQYELRQKSLPYCNPEDGRGKWFLPCLNCQNESSCLWSRAEWSAETCRQRHLTQPQLAECLRDNMVLFIGDSTNRGLMHYLVEQLNRTLTDASKNHDMKIYPNLNGGKTLIGFNYYPKFWLPTSRRSTFEQSVGELIQSATSANNLTRTVLVFGGVQWLASQHIHMLVQTLKRMKLTNVKVIMKSLGIGFHEHVNGVNYLSQEDLRKLAAHNSNLISLASSYGFDFIDSFNITLPRYTEFYEGKCVCHFHKVITRFELNTTSYHVIGDVNRAIVPRFIFSALMENTNWEIIYPSYINKNATRIRGRRVPKEKAVIDPRYDEISAVLGTINGIKVEEEPNKVYPRELNKEVGCNRGRVKYMISDNCQLKSKKDILIHLCTMIPRLKSRSKVANQQVSSEPTVTKKKKSRK